MVYFLKSKSNTNSFVTLVRLAYENCWIGQLSECGQNTPTAIYFLSYRGAVIGVCA